MAKDVILKVEEAERNGEQLVEFEKNKLNLKLRELEEKLNTNFECKKKENVEFYNEVVEEFKRYIDKRVQLFEQEVQTECDDMENKLKKNVAKAVELVLSKFLKE